MAGRAIRQGWLANGLFTSWAEELSALVTGNAPKAQQKKISKRTKRHIDEVTEIIASFCQEFHPARVEPTVEEMAALWERCYGFKSAHLSAALVEQLSLQNGVEWQPRLRALCLLGQCFDENSKAPRLVAIKVHDKAEEVIKYLANQVSQCAEKARQVLELCASPPPLVLPVPPFPGKALKAVEEETGQTGQTGTLSPASMQPGLRRTTGLVSVRGPRRARNPEQQALLSDVGEPEPLEEREVLMKELETETTASSGDDDFKKLQLQDKPFDPNAPQQERTLTASFEGTGGLKEGGNAPPL
ncbi:unnamed protein product [Durusdinium trenchii]|uniref:Uncharacterized protein n=1 Tax=Durusdinium trenchii TaxID=1381693 RepID=A0ABP0M070_9DINO